MEKFKSPRVLALIYTVASIFIGPLILLIGIGLTQGAGDYTDSAYALSTGGFDPIRDSEFARMQAVHVIGASIGIATGLAIIIYTLLKRSKKSSLSSLWPLIGVIGMMVGYTVIIMLAGSWKHS